MHTDISTEDGGGSNADGDNCASVATGPESKSNAEGVNCASVVTMPDSKSRAKGRFCLSGATGIEGRARAVEGSAIVLAFRDEDDKSIHIRASKVGENGIKPGVWYSLNENGEFVESPSI